MKSVIAQGSTFAKAVEEAVKKAGMPREFFIKILEDAQGGFLGFGAKKAKIALFFKHASQDSRVDSMLSHGSYEKLFDNRELDQQIQQQLKQDLDSLRSTSFSQVSAKSQTKAQASSSQPRSGHAGQSQRAQHPRPQHKPQQQQASQRGSQQQPKQEQAPRQQRPSNRSSSTAGVQSQPSDQSMSQSSVGQSSGQQHASTQDSSSKNFHRRRRSRHHRSSQQQQGSQASDASRVNQPAPRVNQSSEKKFEIRQLPIKNDKSNSSQS